MANLTVTAANVLSGTGANKQLVTAGATLTAGQPVYKDTSDSNEYKLADADALATAAAAGITLCGAADGQPVVITTTGNLNPGATLTLGETYVVSTTAGSIAPIGDLGSGDYPTILGVATTTNTLALDIIVSGVAKP